MKKEPKGITIEGIAIMMARSFAKVDEAIKDVKEDVLRSEKRFEVVDENFKKVRHDILSLNDHFITRREFDDLMSRFNALEIKMKGKVK